MFLLAFWAKKADFGKTFPDFCDFSLLHTSVSNTLSGDWGLDKLLHMPRFFPLTYPEAFGWPTKTKIVSGLRHSPDKTHVKNPERPTCLRQLGLTLSELPSTFLPAATQPREYCSVSTAFPGCTWITTTHKTNTSLGLLHCTSETSPKTSNAFKCQKDVY